MDVNTTDIDNNAQPENSGSGSHGPVQYANLNGSSNLGPKLPPRLRKSPPSTKSEAKSELSCYKRGLPAFPRFSYRFVPDVVAWLFGCYGYAVGKLPWLFLVVGILTGGFATAGLFLKFKLRENAADIIDPFLNEGSRYFSDDDVIKAWKKENVALLPDEPEFITEGTEPPDFLTTAEPTFNARAKRSSFHDELKIRKKREAYNPLLRNFQFNRVELYSKFIEPAPEDGEICDFSQPNNAWRYQSVILTPKGGQSNASANFVTEEIMEEAYKFNLFMRELLFCDSDDSAKASTRQLCCEHVDLNYIFPSNPDDENWSENQPPASEQLLLFFRTLTYPAYKPLGVRNASYETFFTNYLGGVFRVDPNNNYNSKIRGFRAIKFIFALPGRGRSLYNSMLIEEHMVKALWKLKDTFEHLDIYWETHEQTQREFNEKIIIQEIPKVGITFVFVVFWCIIAALHTDARNSKPWFGLLGIVCTGFACAAGFGARFWMGDSFQTLLIAVPLMALAIGLDDMFILLNAWHNTDMTLPREERTKLMMQEGGTSIFVTVMMTIVDFVIGTKTPFPAIQDYSNFSLWCLAFDFWLQMTIYVSVLSYSDYFEKQKRQSCCCFIKVKRRTPKRIFKWNVCRSICCSYGRGDQIEPKKSRKKERLYLNSNELRGDHAEIETSNADSQPITEFSTGKLIVYNHVAPVLLHPIGRLVVAILTILFMIGSVLVAWSQIQVGMHPKQLANQQSNTYPFYIAEWIYFRDFTDLLKVEMLIKIDTEAYDSNYTLIRDEILDISARLEKHDEVVWGSLLNRVPIREVEVDLSISKTLRDAVQQVADMQMIKDLKPRLSADNYLTTMNWFQMRQVADLKRGAVLADALRDVQSHFESESDGAIQIYVGDGAKMLRVFDQVVNLPSQFIQFIFITLASTVLTALIMLPSPICIFWMSLSSLCIIAGTMAGMALWDVGLDPVNLIYMLMAIGATADYICNCIYTFTVVEVAEIDLKTKKRLSWAEIRYQKARSLISEMVAETGPAAAGTTLSILVLSTSQNYVLESFFKVFFVAVIVGITFMCIILPVMLCQFGPVSKTCCERELNVDEEATEKSNDDEYVAESHPQPKIGPKLPRKDAKVKKIDQLDAISCGSGKPLSSEEHVVKLKLFRRFLHDTKDLHLANLKQDSYEVIDIQFSDT